MGRATLYIYSPFFSGRNTHILGNDSYSVYEEGDLREIVSGGKGLGNIMASI